MTYRSNYVTGIIFIVALIYSICFGGTNTFAQLDETWTVTVNGQTVQVNPDGSFTIPNISAADQFGTGGPGTSPDFLSDDFLRAVAVSTAGGVTRWAFSEPFQIRSGETFIIGDLTFTDIPPPFPDSLKMSVDDPTLTAIGQTTQLHVTGVLADGSEIDVTPRTAWTIYRTSNPNVATVSENGLVTAVDAGIAFLTAVNEGATAVKRITVVPGDPLTTLEGFVQFEDGSPVNGAEVTVQPVGVTDITDTEGFFQISGVPTQLGNALHVRASIFINSESFRGTKEITTTVPGKITDVGIIIVEPSLGDQAIVANRSGRDVRIVDVPTLSVTATVPIGSDVIDVATTLDGSTAVVSSFGARRLTFLDLLTDPPTVTGSVSVPLLAEDVDIACTSTGIALIADGNIGAPIISVDIDTQTIISVLDLPVTAHGIDVTPDGSLALVNAFNNNLIRLVNVSPTGILTDTGISVPVGSGPLNVTVSPNGRRALVAHWSSNNVAVLEIAGGTVTFLENISLSSRSQSIAFTPIGDKAYVYHEGVGQVSVLDVDANDNVIDSGIRISGVGTALSFFGVDQITVTGDGRTLLVRSTGNVSVIDIDTNSIIGNIPVPDNGGIAAIRR